MVQFSRLKLSGFKSFPDRTELEIGHGLNGVVGPNGCGKSNLLEALRWVMGENSAKRMRGGGMEDVIFNGTDKRSSRNIAEVSLILENPKHDAPAPYQTLSDIEITRKIERDYGSTYKINGKTVRARDVHMFFADTVTGANSPAMVSQGRVTQIINAKPQERRLILEESAGISGLYARRHEAELRLRAAEKNLERMGDLLGSMEGRYQALKRQARQASKYRNLNAQIRQMEIIIAHLEFMALQLKYRSEEQSFASAESDVADHLATVSQLTKTETDQRKELEPLQRKEAEFLAKIQAQRLALQRVEDEQARAQSALKETEESLALAKTDLEHETATASEGDAAIQKLKSEETALIEAQPKDDALLAQRKSLADQLESDVQALERQANNLREKTAQAAAQKTALQQNIAAYESRIKALSERILKAKDELEALGSQDLSADEQAALGDVEAASEKIFSLGEQADILKTRQQQAESEISKAREELRIRDKALSDFEAELALLETLLDEDQDAGRILDDVKASDGFELALSRALGDSLQGSANDTDPKFWRYKGDMLPRDLPQGLEPLLPHIDAPKSLHLALSQIGFVTSKDQGEEHFNQLEPGQAIVSLDGHYWRWDGFCMRAEAKDQNALYLEQKNKLSALKKQEKTVRGAVANAQEKLGGFVKECQSISAEIYAIDQKKQSTSDDLAKSRAALMQIRETGKMRAKETESLNAMIHLTQTDLQAAQSSLEVDQEKLEALAQQDDQAEDFSLEELQENLQEKRTEYRDAMRDYDRFEQDLRTRKARLQAIADERIAIQNKTIRAKERMKTLGARLEELESRLEIMRADPQNQDQLKQDLMNKISEMESQNKVESEKKSSLEIDLAETVKGLKEAERHLGEAREKRAAAGAMLQALKDQKNQLHQAIEEQFQMPPEHLKNNITLDDSALEVKELESCKAEKEQLTHQRNALGAVNLRAEEETAELEEELGVMLKEKSDLEEAINELRGGINEINKEARTKLLAAFDIVNAHFKDLFSRLFRGGKAHLELVDSDDPLGAGLEIFAQPPGKALQSLSLLSGGEQTLASIALIFAMFLTNPSPICVLDEVDAPLDDANVDRFCDLLDDIAMRGDTRFLVITHHRLTMARMDRLYGVTMAEKGVSQLLSVDLQQSFEFTGEQDQKQVA